MKKTLLIVFSFLLFTACSSDDDNENWLNFSKPTYLELTLNNLEFFDSLPLVSATSEIEIDYNNTGVKSKDIFSQMTNSQKSKKKLFNSGYSSIRFIQDGEDISLSSIEIKGIDIILSPYKQKKMNENYTSIFKDVSLYGSTSTAGGGKRGRGLILKYTEFSTFHNANITYTYKGDVGI